MKAQGILPTLVCILAALTVGILTPVSARGEWIILSSGERFQTDRSWREDGRLKFRLNGLVVSVPENDVAQVVPAQTTPKTPEAEGRPAPSGLQKPSKPSDTMQSQRKQRLQKALLLPRPEPKARHQELPEPVERPNRSTETLDRALADKGPDQPAPAPSSAAVSPPSRRVFRDLAWGMRPSSMPGLILSQTNPAYGGVDEFFYPDEELKLGTAPLNGIVYGFWQNRLYTITIWTDGRPSYEKLRRWVIDTYGPGRQRQKEVERQVWYGDGSDRLLEFDEALNTGLFWMRSAKLHARIVEMQPQ
jgi:hypothetical protein